MPLINDFFYVQSSSHTSGTIAAHLQLNAMHRIFEGHFPGQPVVPGVCMLQIIKEMLEAALGQALQMRKADHIKFLAVIDPRKSVDVDAAIRYTCSEDSYEVTASLFKEETVYLKLRGNFSVSGKLS